MSALDQLRDSLLHAGVKSCGIVGVGSSTMEGYLQPDPEKRWFTRLIRAWQAEFGGTDPVQYSQTASFTKRVGTGVHGYNRGFAGTNSSNYLWSGDIVRINSLAPAAVLHAICSNDMAAGTAPSTSKKNLLSKLDMFQGGVPHIFIHHHKRYNQPKFAYYWGDYLAKLKEIEQERENVSVVNLAYEFEHELGIPFDDRFRLMLSDKTHLNAEGHSALAQRAYGALLV